MTKFHKELFFDTSKKVILSKKKKNCMLELKSAILAISQKLVDWPIKYELRLPSVVMPGLLPLRSRSKQCVIIEAPPSSPYLDKG